MTKQTSSGHSLKAITMMNVVTIIMAVNCPAFVITHVYGVSNHEDLRQKRDRDSLSETEEARWKLAFNIKLEIFLDEKGYGVIVRECRERPGMKPFMLRDVAGGMFRGMPERIMRALYDAEQPAEEPKGWKDFGLDKPFPDKGEQFKQNAVREMINFFIEVDDIKFYAYGDPNAQPTKKNGDPGVNGAFNHALNAYGKVAKEYKETGRSSLGELTVALKEYTESKAQELVQKYLTSKVEESEEIIQPDLGFDVDEPALVGGGAAYAD